MQRQKAVSSIILFILFQEHNDIFLISGQL